MSNLVALGIPFSGFKTECSLVPMSYPMASVYRFLDLRKM